MWSAWVWRFQSKLYIKKSFLQWRSSLKIFEFNFLIKTDGHAIVILEPELSKDFVHDVVVVWGGEAMGWCPKMSQWLTIFRLLIKRLSLARARTELHFLRHVDRPALYSQEENRTMWPWNAKTCVLQWKHWRVIQSSLITNFLLNFLYGS